MLQLLMKAFRQFGFHLTHKLSNECQIICAIMVLSKSITKRWWPLRHRFLLSKEENATLCVQALPLREEKRCFYKT